MTELEGTDAQAWEPHLGGERVVEGIHYGWLMRDHLARYHFAAPYTRRKRVLDVATGAGYGANILRRHGALEVVGVDVEQSALDYAATRYGTNGLRWLKADACNMPFDQEFDVVVSFETIEHLKEPEKFVESCKRALKPGGLFIVSTPENAGGPMVSEYHEFEYTREEFRELLMRNFAKVKLYGQRRVIQEKVRPLGDLPQKYWNKKRETGAGSHKLFTLMDRFNKVPSHVLAWMLGVGESYRARILPIDEPIRQSVLLAPHYFAMIGVCRVAEAGKGSNGAGH